MLAQHLYYYFIAHDLQPWLSLRGVVYLLQSPPGTIHRMATWHMHSEKIQAHSTIFHFPRNYSSLIVYRGLIMLSLGVFTSLVVVLARWLQNGQYAFCRGTYQLPNRHCLYFKTASRKSHHQLVIFTSLRETGFY